VIISVIFGQLRASGQNGLWPPIGHRLATDWPPILVPIKTSRRSSCCPIAIQRVSNYLRHPWPMLHLSNPSPKMMLRASSGYRAVR